MIFLSTSYAGRLLRRLTPPRNDGSFCRLQSAYSMYVVAVVRSLSLSLSLPLSILTAMFKVLPMQASFDSAQDDSASLLLMTTYQSDGKLLEFYHNVAPTELWIR